MKCQNIGRKMLTQSQECEILKKLNIGLHYIELASGGVDAPAGVARRPHWESPPRPRSSATANSPTVAKHRAALTSRRADHYYLSRRHTELVMGPIAGAKLGAPGKNCSVRKCAGRWE